MSASDVIAEARAYAEQQMVDTVRITRLSDTVPVLDTVTGEYIVAPPVVTYEGRARIQIPGIVTSALETQAGEREWSLQSIVVQVPVVGSEAVRIDDVVRVTVSVHDSVLVDGRTFTVEGLHHKTHASARRLRCEESTP